MSSTGRAAVSWTVLLLAAGPIHWTYVCGAVDGSGGS